MAREGQWRVGGRAVLGGFNLGTELDPRLFVRRSSPPASRQEFLGRTGRVSGLSAFERSEYGQVSAGLLIERALMSNHTYRVTEIVGTSPESTDQAIRNGVERASETIRNIDWFEVVSVRGAVADGAPEHFQVTLKIGFRLEDRQG